MAAHKQWTGHNLIMPAWSEDISGDRTWRLGPVVPSLVRPKPTLLRVLVQYWATTRPFHAAEGIDLQPPPVGMGVWWSSEPSGGVESDGFIPASGEALWSAVTPWAPTVWAPDTTAAPIWTSAGVWEQQSAQGQREVLNDSVDGLNLIIDWRWDDFDIGPWDTATSFTAWLMVRALWQTKE